MTRQLVKITTVDKSLEHTNADALELAVIRTMALRS